MLLTAAESQRRSRDSAAALIASHRRDTGRHGPRTPEPGPATHLREASAGQPSRGLGKAWGDEGDSPGDHSQHPHSPVTRLETGPEGKSMVFRGAPGGPAPHRRGGGAHQDDRAARGCPSGGTAARMLHPCPENPDRRPRGRTPAPRQTAGSLPQPGPPSGGRLWVGPGSPAPSRTLRLFSLHTLRAAVSRRPGRPVTGGPASRAAFLCPSPRGLGRLSLTSSGGHTSPVSQVRFLTPTLLPGASWATGSGPQTSERPTPEVRGGGTRAWGPAQHHPLQWWPLTTRGLRA